MEITPLSTCKPGVTMRLKHLDSPTVTHQLDGHGGFNLGFCVSTSEDALLHLDCRSDPIHCLFLCGPGANSGVDTFKWLKQIKRRMCLAVEIIQNSPFQYPQMHSILLISRMLLQKRYLLLLYYEFCQMCEFSVMCECLYNILKFASWSVKPNIFPI